MDRFTLTGVAASSLLAVVLAGCGGGEPETVSSDRSKYQVAEETPGGSQAASPRPATSDTPGPVPPVDELSGVAKATSVPNAPGTTSGGRGIAPPPAADPAGSDAEANTGGMPGGAASPVPTAPGNPPLVDSGVAPGTNPYAIQANQVEQILEALRKLAEQQPSGATRAAAMADFQNVQNAMIDGAEKLTSLKTDGKTQQMAAEFKFRALSVLAQLGDPDAPQRITAYCNELMKSQTPEVARLGRRIDFANTLQTFASSPSGDSQRVLRDFQKLFAEEEKDSRGLDFGNQVAAILEQTGHQKESLEVLKTVVAAYENSDPSLAEQVGMMNERLRTVEVDLQGKMAELNTGKPEAVKSLVDAVFKLLEGKPLGELTLNLVRSLTQQIESSQPLAAAQIYKKLSEVYANHKNADLAKQTKDAMELFERRSALVGKPFSITGVTLEGAPLDVAKYQGKVVLVDFWATWCLPCLQEIPNLKKIYDSYRDQGFEIVGVNLDDDVQQLKQFASLQPLPWTTVVGSDPNARGANQPLAVQCGVESIPFFVLIDRNGNAAAINTPRESLDKKIQELLKSPAKGP